MGSSEGALELVWMPTVRSPSTKHLMLRYRCSICRKNETKNLRNGSVKLDDDLINQFYMILYPCLGTSDVKSKGLPTVYAGDMARKHYDKVKPTVSFPRFTSLLPSAFDIQSFWLPCRQCKHTRRLRKGRASDAIPAVRIAHRAGRVIFLLNDVSVVE